MINIIFWNFNEYVIRRMVILQFLCCFFCLQIIFFKKKDSDVFLLSEDVGDDRERVFIDVTFFVAVKSLRKVRKKLRFLIDFFRVIFLFVYFYVVEFVYLNKLWILINFLINMKY